MLNTSGNPILDKNLNIINQYNPQLAEKILNLPYLENNIELIETNLKEPNLSFNGTPIHNQSGAENEVQTAFDNVANTKLSRHIVFGIGLGYLFQKAVETSNGKVILFEPNLEILRVTLELVDLSIELKKSHVVSDFDEFNTIYKKLYEYKSTPSFLALPFYRNLYSKELQEISGKIKNIITACNSAVEHNKLFLKNSFQNVIQNINFSSNAIPLNLIKDKYKDKTAICVSPGPSLDFNIEIIKKNQNNFVIFAVGQALKALAKHNITPDFVNIIEPQDCTGQFYNIDLSNINLILTPTTNKNHFKLNSRKKFLLPSKLEAANQFWSKLTNVDISSYVSKGTVSYAAIASAKILGCKKIILVGQDLAYFDNKCYSKDSAFGGLNFNKNKNGELNFQIENPEEFSKNFANVPEEMAKKHTNIKSIVTKNNLFYVKGITGEMIPSCGGYARFIQLLEDFAKSNTNLDLINTSMKGAQINGFKNIPLDEIPFTPIEKTDFANLNYQTNTLSIKNKINNILKILNEKFNEISKISTAIIDIETEINLSPQSIKNNEEIIKIFNLHSEIPTNSLNLLEENLIKKIPPEELNLKLATIQKFLPKYQKLTQDNNEIFNAITFNERIEIDYILSYSKELTPSTIIVMFERLKYFFIIAEKESKKFIELLEEARNSL